MDFDLPPYGSFKGEARPPNIAQARFHASAAPFKGFLGGVGSGKTHCGARETILGALENGPGKLYLIGAPSHPILETATWDHYCRFLNAFHQHNGVKLDTKRRISPQNRSIVLRGGIVLRFICLKNPSAFAGPTIAGFHIDEAALLEGGIAGWSMLMERLRDTDASRLFGHWTTTPRGPVGVVEHFRRLISSGDDEYFIVTSKTSDNIANLNPGYVRRAMAGKSRREIDQQLNAAILDFDGAVYAGAFCSNASVAWGWDTARDIQRREVYLAIDWGPNNPHVLWIAHDKDEDFDVVFDEMTAPAQHRELLDRAMKHGRDRWGLHRHMYSGIYCDANPHMAVRIARKYFSHPNPRLRVSVHTKTVETGDLLDGVHTVASRLLEGEGKASVRRLLFAPGLENTESERRITQCMRLYQWRERLSSGLVLVDDEVQPLKNGFDHGADALRYYCWLRYRWQRLITTEPALVRRAA